MDDEPYPTLLKDKGGTGFPFLVFMDASGNVLARQRERSPAAFTATHKTLRGYLEMKKKADAGDTALAPDVFLTELELGALTLEEALKRREQLSQVPNDKAARMDGFIASLEVAALARDVQGRDAAKKAAAGAKLAQMFAAGRVPKDDAGARMFFSLLMSHAEAEGDAALFEKAFVEFKAKAVNDPRAQRFIDGAEARLEKLKTGDK